MDNYKVCFLDINECLPLCIADLQKDSGVHVYSHPNINQYTEVTVDIPRQQLIVGAK